MQEHKVQYLESEIFFLSDGLFVKYENNSFHHDRKRLFVFRSFPDLINSLINNAELHFERHNRLLNESVNIFEKMSKPVLAQVNPNVLQYYPRAATSEITVPDHTILLYEMNQKKIRICDPFIVNNKGIAECYDGFEDLEKLRNGISNYFCFTPKSDYMSVPREKRIKIVKENLIRFRNGQVNKDYSIGMPGLFQFLNDLSNLSLHEIKNKSLWIETVFVINGNMMFINDYLLELLYAYFKHIGIFPQKIIDMIIDVKHQWEYAYKLVLKIGYKAPEMHSSKAVDILYRVLEMQNQCFDMVISYF